MKKKKKKVCIAIMRKGRTGTRQELSSWELVARGAIEKERQVRGSKKAPQRIIGILQEGHEPAGSPPNDG